MPVMANRPGNAQTLQVGAALKNHQIMVGSKQEVHPFFTLMVSRC